MKKRAAGLGRLIQEARLRKGWTQLELGERVGLLPAYVSQIETGSRKWPQEHIANLATALGLSQVEMAIAAGLIDRPRDQPEPSDDDPALKELVDLLRQVDLSGRRLGGLRAILLDMIDRQGGQKIVREAEDGGVGVEDASAALTH